MTGKRNSIIVLHRFFQEIEVRRGLEIMEHLFQETVFMISRQFYSKMSYFCLKITSFDVKIRESVYSNAISNRKCSKALV